MFAEWLQEEMMKRGLSGAQLSRDTGICRQTIYSQLHGKQLPYRNTLRAYSEYFEVDMWKLYDMVIADQLSTSNKIHLL